MCPNWDFQALLGVNLNLAMTGQEEVQWKVFTQLGLSDAEIRGWFNGPAYGTVRLNFHHFDRFELDLRGDIHVRGDAFSCLRSKLADMVLI